MGVGGRITGLPPEKDFLVRGIFREFGGPGIEADSVGLSSEDDEVVGDGRCKGEAGEGQEKGGGFGNHASIVGY